MARRLLNLVTFLSLAVSVVSAAMWLRSRFVTEGWEFKPRPSGMIYQGSGRHTYRLVESTGGRLVYADYDWRNDFRIPSVTFPTTGYRRSAVPLTPELRGRLPNMPVEYKAPQGTVTGRIPVMEWWIVPIGYRRRFIAVSWLALAAAGAFPVSVRAMVRWWRWRQRSLPAFPVVTPETQ